MTKAVLQIRCLPCCVAALVVGAFATLVVGTTTGCGGCPWLSKSAVTVTPATQCLDLHIADGSGDAPSAGCVNPVLVGTNGCAEPLSLPVDFSATGQTLEVAPGDPFSFEIELSKAEHSGERYAFEMPANLGTTPVTISFHTDH